VRTTYHVQTGLQQHERNQICKCKVVDDLIVLNRSMLLLLLLLFMPQFLPTMQLQENSTIKKGVTFPLRPSETLRPQNTGREYSKRERGKHSEYRRPRPPKTRRGDRLTPLQAIKNHAMQGRLVLSFFLYFFEVGGGMFNKNKNARHAFRIPMSTRETFPPQSPN
jgi:hypothetical protein